MTANDRRDTPVQGVVTDDDTPLPTAPSLVNPGNRGLLAVVADFYMESRQHTRILGLLYDTLLERVEVAPRLWAHKLLDEKMRHQALEGKNIEALQELVSGTQTGEG